jgi:hypothetical protein
MKITYSLTYLHIFVEFVASTQNMPQWYNFKIIINFLYLTVISIMKYSKYLNCNKILGRRNNFSPLYLKVKLHP